MGLDPAARRSILLSRCGDDPSLVADVEELLAHHDGEAGRAGAGIVTGAMNVGDLFDPAAADAADRPGMGSALASTARYTIQRILGEGGMGTVYLAEQDRPRRTVALKVMRSSAAGAARMRKRFELEAEVLGRLEHPGIARIYDAGVATITTPEGSATVPYFAMEYVDGRSLVQYCQHAQLGTRDRMGLIAQIAEAVAVAHRHGIVHRDLKPANILVDAKGQVKVLDFGVARAVESDLAVTTMQTDVGQLIGTLGYMSPEQIAGDSTRIGVPSDVYALGAITYELLAGEPLIDVRKHTVAQVARIIQDEEPRTLSSFSKVFRGDLETIVSKALEKDPSRRYADAAAFAADVHRFLRDEPIVARPATTLYQISKFARRNRALVGGVIATMAVLVLGLVGTSVGMLRAIDAGHVAEQRRTEAEAATKLAEDRRQDAVAAQQRADNRFSQLRTLAHSFIYDFHDMIADLPGSLEARKKLVETALAYLDGLAAEQSDDIQLQNELSEAYLRIGQVRGYGSKANLGDRAGAMECFQKALAIRVAALAAHPDSAKTLDGICIIRNHIANLKLSQNQLADALADFQLVLADRTKLAALVPGDLRYRRSIAIVNQWIGNTYRDLAGEAAGPDGKGDQAKAKEYHDKALEHYQAFLDIVLSLESSDDPMIPRDIAVGYEKLGDALVDRGDRDAAMAQYAKSLERRERRYKADPNNAETRADLIAATGKVGNALLGLERIDEARPYLERSIELATMADREQPGDVYARTNLLVSEFRMAQLFTAMAATAKRKGAPIEEQRELAAKGVAAAIAALDHVRELEANGKLDPSKKSWPGILAEVLKNATETQRSIESGT